MTDRQTDRQTDRRRLIIGATCVLMVLIIIGCACLYKLYKHEKNQSKQINNALYKVSYLEEKLKQTIDYYEYDTEYLEDGYNYFAIGNSLTMINSWGRGICSTQPDNDYVNLVKKYIEQTYGECVSYAYNLSYWERAEQRSDTLELLDPYLDEKLDLVTIQLGENAISFDTFTSDMVELIDYVRIKCPNAQIIIIGDFWDSKRNEYRKKAAEQTSCAFADLSEIMGNSEYQSKTGIVCYLKDGTTVEVSEEAATHPGDKGMEYIANKVIEMIE